MSASALIAAAARFETTVNNLTGSGYTALDAFNAAQDADPDGAEAYRLRITGALPAPEPAITLSAHGGARIDLRDGEDYFQLCERIAHEQCGGDIKEGRRRCSQAFPDMETTWSNGSAL